ncbi:cytochrome P450 9e2-like [Sabethes cyaneus]|uniref:cytochrome P450 9e2-like n=1 Tax=Sabethes cyaneus TaxID=53552 RepID=UPI00237DA921|nr:cytochrome P450 9e2-like [Sabethes cyaneus]
MILEFICLLTASVAVLVFVQWFTGKDDYFGKRSIPALPEGLLFGNTRVLMFKKSSMGEFVKMVYDKFPGEKVVGMYDVYGPVFVLTDPELIKKIMVKQFDSFVDRRPFFWNPKCKSPKIIINRTLLTLMGQRWRNMRATLSPAFTGSKMRQMFELIVECSASMVTHYKKRLSTVDSLELDMKDMFTKFTNDVIATCAFGIKVDSLENPENEFYINGRKMMRFNRLSVAVRVLAIQLFPRIMDVLGIDIVDREQLDYFTNLILRTVRTRQSENILRRDMVQLLIEARNGILKHEKETDQPEGFATVQESKVGLAQKQIEMTEIDLVAQCIIFFVAGFDTVSTCLTFFAYELAMNPQIQQRLYEEILETHQRLSGKSIDYETLQSMKFMDMCVSESLRLWPPIPMIDRLCVRDYQVDEDPLRFTIDKGTAVWIPVHALHRDPKYYPQPERYDPERFAEENRHNLNTGAYLPFGAGPRNCIGSRLALTEVKSIVYHLLLNFSLERTAGTPVPMRLARGFAATNSEREVVVGLKLRK